MAITVPAQSLDAPAVPFTAVDPESTVADVDHAEEWFKAGVSVGMDPREDVRRFGYLIDVW